MNRKGFKGSSENIDDENQIPSSSCSSSSYENNHYSSDDERTIQKRSSMLKRLPTSSFEEPNREYCGDIKRRVTVNMLDALEMASKQKIDKPTSNPSVLSKIECGDRKPIPRFGLDTDEEEDDEEEDLINDNDKFAPDFLNWSANDNNFNQSDPIDTDLDEPIKQFGSRRDALMIIANQLTENGRNLVIHMCSQLLECRNLIEAIEYVEGHRRLIDQFTKIIREAPAYRNYDFSSYQIDYSVKESFNSDFWLDREPILTTADGNCQYHAVSISLTGSEIYTPQVRLAAAVAVIDNRDWFDSILQLIDRGTVLDLVHTISRNYSWGDETTLKAIAVAINRRIFLYTCNLGKKDYELVKSLSREELLDAFMEKKYRGGTGIHVHADPLTHVNPNNYIMLFHKSEHFIAVLPTTQQLTMYEPFNPILPNLT